MNERQSRNGRKMKRDFTTRRGSRIPTKRDLIIDHILLQDEHYRWKVKSRWLLALFGIIPAMMYFRVNSWLVVAAIFIWMITGYWIAYKLFVIEGMLNRYSSYDIRRKKRWMN